VGARIELGHALGVGGAVVREGVLDVAQHLRLARARPVLVAWNQALQDGFEARDHRRSRQKPVTARSNASGRSRKTVVAGAAEDVEVGLRRPRRDALEER